MCKELGIDDPVAWFNAVPESVIDGWAAFWSLESDEMAGKASKMMDPLDAMKMLQEKMGR